MADFGVQATSLSEPQGAGTSPINPAQQQVVDTSMYNVVGGLVDIFNKGLQQNAKLEAEKLKNAIVGQHSGELGKINDALASGQLTAAEASVRTRAINNKYAANYSQYMDEFAKTAKFFNGETEIGEAQKAQQAEAQQWQSDISQAQQRGMWFPPGMSKEGALEQIKATKIAVRYEHEFEQREKERAAKRAQGTYDAAMADREDKDFSWKMINEVSGSQIGAAQEFIKSVGDGVRSGKLAPELAQAQLAERFSNIETALTAAAGKNQDLAAAYRGIFKELHEVGKKLSDPKTMADNYEDQLKSILARTKIMMIKDDPKFRADVAANQLLPGNTELALYSSNDAVQAVVKFAGGDVGPYNPVIGNPTVEADALKNFKGWLKTFDDPKHPNPELAKAQMATTVNGLLSQTGKFLDSGQTDPKKLAPIASWFASPEYARYVANGQIDRDAALAAMKTFQILYEPEVIKAVQQRLQGALFTPDSNANGFKPTKITDAVDIKFNGQGISFEPKAKPGMMGVELRKQADLLKDLKKAQEGVNQLIHIGAHMEGTTNYAKYWEANKHLYFPNVYPAPDKPSDESKPAKQSKQQTASAEKPWWEQ